MKPNAKQLAMRDPALAALMGVEDNGADFGSEFGNWGYEFGDDPTSTATVASGIGPAMSMGVHPAVAAAASAAMTKPTAQQALSAWHSQNMQKAQTASRTSLLSPNAGSDVNVERYTFSLNATLVLGTSGTLGAGGAAIVNNPDTNFRPQQVTINAPAPGFVFITELKVANVSVTVGGQNDAYQFNANGVGRHLDMPTLSPANRASAQGSYSGYVPPGYTTSSSYIFCISFTGPASLG